MAKTTGKSYPTRTPGRNATRALASQRRAIEALDERILKLVARRLDVAESIGRAKCEHGIPLRNFEVEAQVQARLEDLALGHGLERVLGRDLALFLIEHSLQTQSALIERVYSGDRLQALVVGGMGGMGRWVARFLNGQGHGVTVLDPAPGECPFPRAERLATGLAGADLVMIAVPMSACGPILKEIADLRPRGVIAEMCSFKTHLAPSFEALKASGVRFASFHPLFGPGVSMLTGKNIVFCTEGDTEATALVKGLFAATSAALVDMSASEHDRRMALVLGMTHLCNIGLARALSKSGTSFGELSQAAGVTFHKQVGTTREVASENPALYFEIQALNPSTRDTVRWLTDSLAEILRAVEARDEEGFEAIMNEGRRYFAV